jgi:hypothetical protein
LTYEEGIKKRGVGGKKQENRRFYVKKSSLIKIVIL